LTPINMNRSSDSYVESKLIPVTVESGEKHRLSNFKTRISRSTLNPQWYESFTM
jgi:Ca2+-dependent lipid-binding protein